MESDEPPGRPAANRNNEMMDKVRALLKGYRRLTIKEVSEEVEISIVSCHAVVTEDLSKRRVAAKFLPQVLIAEHDSHLFAATGLV